MRQLGVTELPSVNEGIYGRRHEGNVLMFHLLNRVLLTRMCSFGEKKSTKVIHERYIF